MATTSAEQIRTYTGPALFSYGFRPFFLFGAIWAALAVALWLPLLHGEIRLASAYSAVEWHVHELVYGYVPAIIAGFLLTAVPNWTGRLPVVGWRLAALFAVWVAGRLAMLLSGAIGARAAAVIDVAFLVVFAAVVAREIVAAGNTRNLKVLGVLAVLAAGNVLFHIEAIGGIGRGHGARVGIAGIVLLIMLIGGRIIPSFTRNWLARREPGRLPAPFGRYDVASMVVSAVALASWVLLPAAAVTAGLAVIAAGLNAVRLGRWAGERTTGEPLVAVLHVGFAFVPVGFALVALSIFAPRLVADTGALHAWTVGAVGMMTLAVMTRASFGHTGQPLTATRPVQLIFAAIAVAAVARIVVAFGLWREPMLHLSAAAWVVAFGGFAVVYWPLLMRARAR